MVKMVVQRLLDSTLMQLEEAGVYMSQKGFLGTYPYISGDNFIGESDKLFLGGRLIERLGSVRDRKMVVFCDGESEVDLIKWADSQETGVVGCVIFHNTDKAPSAELKQKCRDWKAVLFGVNMVSSKDGQYCLPLGLENARLRINTSLRYYNIMPLRNRELRKATVLLSIRRNTNEAARSDCIDKLESLGISNRRLSRSDYRKGLRESMYVACPRGNGLDTHRFWEALYNRAIPVVKRSEALFNGEDFPCLIVDDWADIGLYDRYFLEEFYYRSWEKSWVKLSAYYWTALIRECTV